MSDFTSPLPLYVVMDPISERLTSGSKADDDRYYTDGSYLSLSSTEGIVFELTHDGQAVGHFKADSHVLPIAASKHILPFIDQGRYVRPVIAANKTAITHNICGCELEAVKLHGNVILGAPVLITGEWVQSIIDAGADPQFGANKALLCDGVGIAGCAIYQRLETVHSREETERLESILLVLESYFDEDWSFDF